MGNNEVHSTTSVDGATADGARRRVRIGIPIPIESAAWRVWEGRSYLLSLGYVTHFHRAGASVLLLPVPETAARDITEEARGLVESLDGLVIAGGPDVDPSRYGESASPKAGPFDPVRDAWETALIDAAMQTSRPVFGICRGLQLINVILGGTLVQHLPHRVGNDDHNPTVGAFGEHSVHTVSGSWLRGAIGEVAEVATYHHQAIDVLGAGLRITASAEDGTIEGVEDLERGLVGVQWHPEARDHTGVLTRFVRLCAERTRTIKTD